MIPSGPEAGIVLAVLLIGVLGLAGFVTGIIALVDVAGRTDADFAAAQGTRTSWLVGTIVGTFLCGLGILVGPYYLFKVKPQLPTR